MRRPPVTGVPEHLLASGGAARRGGAGGMLAVALLVMGAVACSTAEPASCPNDLPASCPSPAPTFSAEVAPLIQNHCAGCHSPDGGNPMLLLVSYDTVTSSMGRTASMIETALANCRMPPADQPPLTSKEKQTILGWIVCGAKND